MHSLPYRPARQTGLSSSGFVEWDDTPSFADSLPERLQWRTRTRPGDEGPRADYPETMPAELLPEAPPSNPFREPVEGLSVREVLDADVFQHFFGTP